MVLNIDAHSQGLDCKTFNVRMDGLLCWKRRHFQKLVPYFLLQESTWLKVHLDCKQVVFGTQHLKAARSAVVQDMVEAVPAGMAADPEASGNQAEAAAAALGNRAEAAAA